MHRTEQRGLVVGDERRLKFVRDGLDREILFVGNIGARHQLNMDRHNLDDGRGTIIEVVPIHVQLVPGTDVPDEENFSIETITDEFEATFVPDNETSLFGSVHVNINSPLNEEAIKAI